MSFWLLYLMTRTEGISMTLRMLGAFGAIVGITACIFAVVFGCEGDLPLDAVKKIGAAGRLLLIAGVTATLISCLMPSRQDWYLMIGGYYVTHIDGIDQLPKDTVGAIDEFLKQYHKEKKQEKGV